MKRKICKTPNAQEIGKLEGKRVGWLQEPSEQGLPISLRHCEERSGAAIQPLEETSIVASLQTPFRHSELDSESHNQRIMNEHLTSTTMRLRIPSRVAQTFHNDEKIEPIPPTPLVKGGKKAAFTLAEGASPGAMSDSQRKIAFTLAEVLITLGIIGVVAAMTLPAVIHNYKKKLIETRLQRTIATISQVVGLIEAEQGDINNWSFDPNSANQNTAQMKFAEDTILKHVKGAKICKNNQTIRECNTSYTIQSTNETKSVYSNKILLPDGTGFWIGFPDYNVLQNPDNNRTTTKLYIDLNINKKPIYGIDYFQMVLLRYPNGVSKVTAVHTSGHDWWSGFNPYLPKCGFKFEDKDSNSLDSYTVCANPQADNHYGYQPVHCAALIQCNGWKVPKDYPIKI